LGECMHACSAIGRSVTAGVEILSDRRDVVAITRSWSPRTGGLNIRPSSRCRTVGKDARGEILQAVAGYEEKIAKPKRTWRT
jgi:hypothetical protein